MLSKMIFVVAVTINVTIWWVEYNDNFIIIIL